MSQNVKLTDVEWFKKMMPELPERLRVARNAARLQQQQVGVALGVSELQVTMWESGQKVPSLRRLLELSALYQVNLTKMLGR